MVRLIYAVLTAILMILSAPVFAVEITGLWQAAEDTEKSYEFFKDGSFVEFNNDEAFSGIYSIDDKGQLVLTYSPLGLPVNVSVYDKIIFDGSDLIMFSGNKPEVFSRTFTASGTTPALNTYNADELIVNDNKYGLKGIWYSGLNSGHSVELYSDGSFLERKNDITQTGLYYLNNDGIVVLTYLDGNSEREVINPVMNIQNIAWLQNGNMQDTALFTDILNLNE